MREFLSNVKKVNEAIDALADEMISKAEVYEYFEEIYGAEVEDNPVGCILRYLWDMEEN